MKVTLLLATIIALSINVVSCSWQTDVSKDKNIPTGDNTMNSVDWDGTYFGVLPCTDCEGIETTIKLNKDLTYEIKTKYLGKNEHVFEYIGTFSWDEQGNKITLTDTDNAGLKHYFVGENIIMQLDMKGNQIIGDLADKYVLRKALPEITEKYWKLVELNGKKVQHNEWDKRELHMILKTDNNRVTGSGGCNTFNGAYELNEGNRITFSKIATTLMSCENMETETQFFRALEMTNNYFLNADTLVLHKARMAPLARLEAVYFR